MKPPLAGFDPHVPPEDPRFRAQLAATLDALIYFVQNVGADQLSDALQARLLGPQPVCMPPRAANAGGGGGLETTITSPEDGDILVYDNGTATWINSRQLNLQHDPGGIGVSFPTHELIDDRSQSLVEDSVVLALRAINNTYNFGQHGTSLAFFGRGGTFMGKLVARRTGSTSGHMALQGSTQVDLLSVKDYSSQQRVVLHGDAILAMEDTLTSGTYTPEGSGFGHLYWKNGDLYVVPPGGSEGVLVGTGSVQDSFQNADNVLTATSADGEILVDNGSGSMVASDRWTQEDATNGQKLRLLIPFNAVVTASSGAGSAATAGTLLPAGAVIWSITLRITTTFGNTNGLTALQLARTSNVGTDPDELGQTSDRTAGTTLNSNKDATAAGLEVPWAVGSSDDGLTVTTVGGNFDADGQLRIAGWYYLATPPTS